MYLIDKIETTCTYIEKQKSKYTLGAFILKRKKKKLKITEECNDTITIAGLYLHERITQLNW